MNNNPLRYNDPSGHDVGCSAGDPNCNDQNNFTETDRELLYEAQYGAWNSSKYGGCFKCHAAVQMGEVTLTNQELATAYQNMQEWQAIGYAPMIATVAAAGVAEVAAPTSLIVQTGTKLSPPVIGKMGVDQVMKILNDSTAQTEVQVYIGEAGKRANVFARLDIVTSSAIHEVKNVADLSLTQNLMNQAYRYKSIADSAGLEMHYWLMNSSPEKVVNWLQRMGIFVH